MADESNEKQQLVDIKSFLRQLSTGQMISLGVMVVTGLILVISVGAYLTQERMVPLFREPLDAKTFVEVKEILDNRKVDYETERDHKILVPESLAPDLRTELEAQDISAAGPDGWTVFDESSPLKVGESMMEIQKLRAKEANLSRYLKQNPVVQNAFVQITPGKDSPFADEVRGAKASVMLELTDLTRLSRKSVEGMQRYIANAIEDAHLEDVVITDQFHNVLTPPPMEDDVAGVSQKNLQIKKEMEHNLVSKILQITEPVVGRGRVVPNVSLEVDFDQVSSVLRQYGGPDAEGEPQTQQEEVRKEESRRISDAGAGVGTAANTAQGGIDQGAPAGSTQTTKSAETKQYLIDETQITRTEAPLEITRMSVALNVDHKEVEVEGEEPGFFSKITRHRPDWITTERQPLTQDELQNLGDLVKASIGFVPGRDTFSIQNFAFKPAVSKKTQAALEIGQFFDAIQRWVPWALELLVFLAFIIVGVRLFRRFVSPILQQAQLEEPAVVAALPSSTPKTVAELESELEQEIEASLPATRTSKSQIIKKRVAEVCQQDPAAAASLLRTWILEDD